MNQYLVINIEKLIFLLNNNQKKKEKNMLLIDGFQRVNTLYEFYNDNIKLKGVRNSCEILVKNCNLISFTLFSTFKSFCNLW